MGTVVLVGSSSHLLKKLFKQFQHAKVRFMNKENAQLIKTFKQSHQIDSFT